MAACQQHRSSPEYPHPALFDAIYLWGTHFSQQFASWNAEQTVLARAIERLQTQDITSQSLQHGLQVIQAEILLATYMFAVGSGSLETDYRVSAAIRLALGFGMHHIARHSQADVHEEERIAIFWRVFCLDRMWAVANGKPANLSLRGRSGINITTPWPQSLEEPPIVRPADFVFVQFQCMLMIGILTELTTWVKD